VPRRSGHPQRRRARPQLRLTALYLPVEGIDMGSPVPTESKPPSSTPAVDRPLQEIC
jgi:hypothetical protein